MKKILRLLVKWLVVPVLGTALVVFVMSFLVAGIFGIYRGIEVSRISQTSYSWPATEGLIAESYIHTYERSDDDGTKTWHETVIRYSYSVDGKSYTANTITLLSPGPNTTDRSDAAALVSDFPAGMTASVYYDPQAPQNAVLIRKRMGWLNGFSGGGIFCLIIWGCGVIGLVAAFKKG